MGKIILFYKYVDIVYPVRVKKWLGQLCQSLQLKGRIIVAQEGINGTVGGTLENIAKFKKAMAADSLFSNIDFKESDGDHNYFPKLRIVVRKEVVSLGIDPEKLPATQAGNHLTPAQMHTLLEGNDPNVVVLDARNYFESKVGRFKNAHRAKINHFRELPNYIDEHLDEFKDKTVVMYCTGGIRCERGSAYLKSKNVAKEVYQLQGGIHRYCEQYRDGFFRGKNYVFDGRITVKINDDVMAQCDLCAITCDEFLNCINAECNQQIVACNACVKKFNNTCSMQCRELVEQKKVVIRTKPAKMLVNSCQI